MVVPAFTLLALAQATADTPAKLPDGVRAMIEAAIAAGDAKTIETVIRLARDTHPFAGGEIDEIQQRWRLRLAESEAARKREREQALASAGMFDNWKGQVELGASRSTGKSSYLGFFGSVAFNREGLRWRHKLDGRAEVQKGRNVLNTERYVASWQPNYKWGPRIYAYGLAQFESDRIQGYDGRYTLSGGLGYAVLTGDKARLDFEGGPAFRHVDAISVDAESSLAARASINFRWAVTPTLEIKQTSALYFEEGESSANALTAIDAKLLGPLKARLSYDVRYEDRIGNSGGSIDTLGRATLVYSF
ncbi:DUF481 domain-containing protein [Sphingomonas parva]|uniref:DUF481 domain-containing protein n=1 Tax=Sphingomonas parva TaxID=2555898 RepID=A0A4Y8ZV41_9SPHN|nr:DUF481 domain-containing protein [Sphingomonas parva]TFI59182.1 DUF481 domain-containing protein [Sphingomonas parva]